MSFLETLYNNKNCYVLVNIGSIVFLCQGVPNNDVKSCKGITCLTALVTISMLPPIEYMSILLAGGGI